MCVKPATSSLQHCLSTRFCSNCTCRVLLIWEYQTILISSLSEVLLGNILLQKAFTELQKEFMGYGRTLCL